jgi:hypothetical protein
MNCNQTAPLLSLYLDGALTGHEMQQVERHLAACADCNSEYKLLAATQRWVARLGRPPAPADLAVRLEVALSQAAAQSYRNRWQGWLVRTHDSIESFMFPATAGLLSAVFFFGLIIGFFAIPVNVQASSADVPVTFYTPPQLNTSPFPASVGTSESSLVVETFVDADGRVQDYRIISAPPGTEKLLPELDNMMIFTTFSPATNFGRPTSSRVVLSFSGVNVKG